MSDLKTDYTGYNEDNFIEVDGQLKELTVTITLCEYRNLIEDRVYSEKAIQQLQEENEKLRNTNELHLMCLMSKYPEIVEKVKDAYSEFINAIKESGKL